MFQFFYVQTFYFFSKSRINFKNSLPSAKNKVTSKVKRPTAEPTIDINNENFSHSPAIERATKYISES